LHFFWRAAVSPLQMRLSSTPEENLYTRPDEAGKSESSPPGSLVEQMILVAIREEKVVAKNGQGRPNVIVEFCTRVRENLGSSAI